MGLGFGVEGGSQCMGCLIQLGGCLCASLLLLLQLPYEQLRLLLEQRSSEVEVLRNRLDQREASLEALKRNYDTQVGVQSHL